MATHPLSGLCWLHGATNLYHQLPLRNVRVDASLYDLCAEVNIQQTYCNDMHSESTSLLHDASTPLECIYIFPLDEESAVFSFVAELDGVMVKGRIREKMEAHADYNTAIALNHAAMLLEQSSDNIFHCKIGNLNPGSVCTITLTYLTLLEQQGRHNCLTLPMIIAPKYTPASVPGTTWLSASLEPAPHNTLHTGYSCHHCLSSPIIGTRHHCSNCAYDLCHGCHMQHDMTHSMLTFTGQTLPPTLPAPAHPPLQGKLRDLTISLNITMPSPIISIQCPSHSDETKVEQNSGISNHGTVLFHSTSTSSLSKDFIVLVEQQRCFEPRVLCEMDVAKHTAAVSLAFIPPPLDMLSASQIRCELIFLLDCSGSMRGTSIACVRECMQLLLRSLPIHSWFNILVFGSRWSSLFPTSQAYNDTSLSAASQYISKLEANLGGTEIYAPLSHVLQHDLLPTHPRQVFLLTDGQVSNVKQLVQLTSQHAVTTRLFTFGIGGSVDRLLCKKLAKAGRGKCEFVTAKDGGESDMREKVVRQVARAMQPVLTDVKVDWGQLKGPKEGSNAIEADDSNTASTWISTMPLSANVTPTFLQCPSVAPAIFMSSRYVLHALNVSLPKIVWQQAEAGQKVDFECEIIITACSNHPHETDQMHHSVVLTGDQITQARVIHTMAAKERVRELEDKLTCSTGEARQGLENEILQLAMRHTLSSSRTSFVVVYNPETTNTEVVTEMACFGQTGEENKFSALHLHHFARSSSGVVKATAQPVLFGSALETPKGHPRHQQYAFGRRRVSLSQSKNITCSAIEHKSASKPAPPPLESTGEAFGSTQTGDCFGIEKQCTNLESMETVDLLGFRGTRSPTISSASSGSMQLKADTMVSLGNMPLFFEGSQTTQEDAKSSAFKDLIHLQSANGVWHITPMLIDIAHAIVPTSSSTITMQSLQGISKEHGLDEAMVGVLLALHLLETHYKHRYAEWEMLATKALFFVVENGKVNAELRHNITNSISKLL